MNCVFCGKLITERGDTYPEVIGFAKPRKQGGLNALLAQRSTGRYACHSCITAVRHGIKVGEQERLFDDVG